MQPFRIEIPEADVADLRKRIAEARWPVDTAGADWQRGVPQEYLKELAGYWLESYDWRAAEEELNRFPQYTTEIDGATVHYLHVRSAEPNALPLLITHGWPSSVAEFLKVIGPLTDPVAHGGRPEDAFHVVIPSIPGYGFSGPLPETGWSIPRVAGAWAELMRRLGYERYGAQGGDWGGFISLELGRQAPEHVVGVHTSMLLAVPSGDPEEMAALGEQDLARLGRLAQFDTDGSGYMKIQSTRPRTPAYALADSPIGQLAWIVEKFKEWTAAGDVPEDVIDRDQLLTNVMLYWLTGTAGTAAQMYYEVAEAERGAAQQPADRGEFTVPVGVAVCPDDIIVPVRRLAERDYPTIMHWTEFERGGHFPALEVPELYVEDVRAFFLSLKR
ncbi:epoxide hydrolase family protein [Streptomyces sp. Da 82-17]|uniref:epoxide hydrolase family protein n=1 Tax=Streptomyces sp. Da 82-17 TaxID=3377116 RepID=UPI0038D4DB69